MSSNQTSKKKTKDFEIVSQKEIFTVTEVNYSDGVTRYSIDGIHSNGHTYSSGMYNDIDLLIEVLSRIGKISNYKVYVSK